MNNIKLTYRIVLFALMLIAVGCSSRLYIPSELIKHADEKILNELGYQGDVMADHRDCMILADGIVIAGTKNIKHKPFALNPGIPQLTQRIDSLRSRKAKCKMGGYYFLGNDTADYPVNHPVNGFNYLKVPVLGLWSRNAGSGFIAANCMATRYVYDHSLIPKRIEYRINNILPDERAMQKYVRIEKRDLKGVTLTWDNADSVLSIGITLR